MRSNGILIGQPTASPVVAARGISSSWYAQLFFLAAHAPLALMIPKHSSLATLHALLVLGVGLLFAVLPRRSHISACAAAYLTGGAVFWRMRAAPQLPWEFGKYAVSLVFLVALVFAVRVRRPVVPIVYMALLLPSALLTISAALPAEEIRATLSFNLSGPFALAVSVLFFSSVRLSVAQMRWLWTSLLAPIISVATLAAQSLAQALGDPEFEFYGGSSNATASGGFGPNQVSAILGLGIVAVCLYLISGRSRRSALIAMLALMVFLFRQCLITLSRGGLYMAVGAVSVACVPMLRDVRLRRQVVAGLLVVGAIVVCVVIPRLDAMTGGVLVSRFENTSGTGRAELIRGDLESWSTNPVLGVGPGLGAANRLKYFYAPAAHTEYTRLVAEHGLLGLASLCLLAVMAARALRGAQSTRGRAYAGACLTYALLFMAVDAMRLVAPAFMFGLAGVTLIERRRATAAVSVSRHIDRGAGPARAEAV